MIKFNLSLIKLITNFTVFLFLIHINCFAAFSKTLIKGDNIAGGILLCQSFKGAKVYLDGKEIPVSNSGSFVVGFHRDPKSIQIIEIQGND